MKIYCNYCNTPTHADTSCPYQLKEEIMSQCSKCKNLILEPHTTYGINPLAVCRCATMTTPEDTELNNHIFSIIGQASMCWSKTPTGVYDDTRAVELGRELMNLITLHTQKAKWQGHIHAAKSLKRQAELLGGTPEYMLNQFDTHIELSIARLTNPTERSNK